MSKPKDLCECLTSKKQPCKKTKVKGSDFCIYHQDCSASPVPRFVPRPTSPVKGSEKKRCESKTGLGVQCSRKAVDGSRFCSQHKKLHREDTVAAPTHTRGIADLPSDVLRLTYDFLGEKGVADLSATNKLLRNAADKKYLERRLFNKTGLKSLGAEDLPPTRLYKMRLLEHSIHEIFGMYYSLYKMADIYPEDPHHPRSDDPIYGFFEKEGYDKFAVDGTEQQIKNMLFKKASSLGREFGEKALQAYQKVLITFAAYAGMELAELLQEEWMGGAEGQTFSHMLAGYGEVADVKGAIGAIEKYEDGGMAERGNIYMGVIKSRRMDVVDQLRKYQSLDFLEDILQNLRDSGYLKIDDQPAIDKGLAGVKREFE